LFLLLRNFLSIRFALKILRLYSTESYYSLIKTRSLKRCLTWNSENYSVSLSLSMLSENLYKRLKSYKPNSRLSEEALIWEIKKNLRMERRWT
jgi:outer membrane lipopolysaccharide assembly protein LptE/RlpB